MRKVLQLLAMAVVAWPAGVWAQAPKDGIVISGEDVKAVLKYAVDTKRTTVDNTIRVIDMGAYQLSVAVVHRGPTGRPAPRHPQLRLHRPIRNRPAARHGQA
jgi:hypothetical protein